MNITGNTILITGGTSGIGRALAEALHDKGNQVIVAGRRQALLDEVARARPGIVGMPVDVTDAKSIRRLAADVIERFPALNVVVNNAGISRPEDYTAASVSTETAVETVQTNIVSVLELTAALLPHLRAQPRATLITTTSGLAFVPYPKGPTYSATKAFLHNWLEALRMQLRGSSVEVLELAPPYVQTELGGPEQARDPRAMPLADFTAEVMAILEGNRAEKGEILVEGVKGLRWAEKNGNYDQLLSMFASF